MIKNRLEEIEKHIEHVTPRLSYINREDYDWLIKTVREQEEELDHYRSMAALKVAGVCTNTNAKNVK